MEEKLTKEEGDLLGCLLTRTAQAYEIALRDWKVKYGVSVDNILYPDMSLVEYIDLLRGIVTTKREFLNICQDLEAKHRIKVIAVADDKVVVRVLGHSYL